MTATGADAVRHPHPLIGAEFDSPVPPGTGWPGDPATPDTPVVTDADSVRARASTLTSLTELDAEVSVCRACPRLVQWRESVAVEKRRSYADEPYWGRPIAGWGSARPAVVIVGLAPAAHGGNRTGRIFTGDRSGDWLFASLHRAGLAATPTSVHAGDGQQLVNARMVAAVRCAPPANKPTPHERDTCAPWLDGELAMLLPTVRAVVCLGSFGWSAAFRALVRQGYAVPRPRPAFGHGARVDLPRPVRGAARTGVPANGGPDAAQPPPVVVLGCYHPSQQNTLTGTLTEPMLDAVLGEAARLGST
ncbi:MAG: uracil-DNA glycosylase [Nocardioidaceae bacterium]